MKKQLLINMRDLAFKIFASWAGAWTFFSLITLGFTILLEVSFPWKIPNGLTVILSSLFSLVIVIESLEKKFKE